MRDFKKKKNAEQKAEQKEEDELAAMDREAATRQQEFQAEVILFPCYLIPILPQQLNLLTESMCSH